MTDPTTGHDDAVDSALRGMPRPVVDPARREAHIAAALGALDTGTTSGETSNVVSLASRRRPRLATLTAVAAAGLFVVGLGIGRVSAPDAPAPETQVKNAALTTVPDSPQGDPLVAACPALDVPSPARVVTQFGTYVLVRSGDEKTGEFVVVDTAACAIITRVDLSAGEG
jgi:hypothetical protein